MNTIMQIPFSHLDRNGIVKVDYIQNPGPEVSGFDVFKNSSLKELCHLYPTVDAKIEQYDGTGYRKCMGWIQIITFTRYKSNESPNTYKMVDIDMMGYSPELYDAPCNNLQDSDKLRFFAESFLTTSPAQWNNETISFLAGFQWGYEEYDADGIRKVDILPCKQINGSAWNAHIDFLRTNLPKWKYVEYNTN